MSFKEGAERFLQCPECGAKTRVTNSRPKHGGISRRRECDNLHRFNTKEVLVDDTESGRLRVIANMAREFAGRVDVMAACIEEREP